MTTKYDDYNKSNQTTQKQHRIFRLAVFFLVKCFPLHHVTNLMNGAFLVSKVLLLNVIVLINNQSLF